MRTITNDYHDAQVFDLGSRGARGPYLEDGPYLVTQIGVSPRDPLSKTSMFVLRPDGYWVDFNSYASPVYSFRLGQCSKRHDVFRLARLRSDLPITFCFLQQHQFPVGRVKHVRAGVS